VKRTGENSQQANGQRFDPECFKLTLLSHKLSLITLDLPSTRFMFADIFYEND